MILLRYSFQTDLGIYVFSLYLCAHVLSHRGKCSPLQRLTNSFIMVQNMQMQPQNICLWQQLHKCHTLLPEGQLHSYFTQMSRTKNRPKPDLT